jgi:hypothetical protein
VNICCEEEVVEKFKSTENLGDTVSSLDHHKSEEKRKQLGRPTEIIDGQYGVDLLKQKVVLSFPDSQSAAVRTLKLAGGGLQEVDLESRCHAEMKKRIAEDLNDRLITEPDLVPSFFEVLWPFGFYVVAVQANIPGMRFCGWVANQAVSMTCTCTRYVR